MKKDIKVMIGAGLIVTAMGSMPLLAQAANPSDYITNKTNAIQPNPLTPSEAVFTTGDQARRSFYSNQAKRLDSQATNRLYKMTEKGYTYWSPVREKGMKSGGVSNGEYIYENFYTSHMYNNGYGSAWLNNLWVEDVKVTSNFKNKQIKKSEVNGVKGRTKANMQKVGVIVEKSEKFNNGGNFKGKSGRWRFNGYATDGSTSTDPFFPGDYAANSIKTTQWDQYAKYGNQLFSPTIYDTATHKNAKRKLIQRLLKQEPGMKVKTVNQWMSILSLQSEPEVNPKTGKKDGTYGGASFNAYNSYGSKYRGFILFNESNLGSMNLNLSKLVVTENKKNSKGNYPVVATITRKEAESRATKNSQVIGSLVPGKTYRIVSTVKNESKVTKTKYNPTSTNVGYATNYNGSKIEKDGIYDPKYNNSSKVAKKAGTIAEGKSTTTITTFKMPNNLKPATKVRFGSEINDNHRKKGDNLNYMDDELKVVVPVSTGNLSASSVVLVDQNGKEVSNPLPGHKYKMRYKFKYAGTSQNVASKVTINYQNTRYLPDGNQETMIYANGSQSKKDVSASKNIVLKNGSSYSIDSGSYQWYEIPHIKTVATLSSDVAGLNTNSKDDKFNKTWNEKYDYSIENLQVVARTERDGLATDNKQHYGVSFTVGNTMPNIAANDNYAQDVNIRIALGDKTQVITEHIVAGKNKDIVVDIPFDGKIKDGSILNAKVDINYDGLAYETNSPGKSNNVAVTKVDSSKLQKDSVTGSITNPSNNSTNTGAYVDTPIDPNKQTSTTKSNNANKWTQKYTVNSWNAEKVSYKGLNGKKTYSFYRYKPTANTVKNVAQEENYKITEVLMKSKETTDNKWGDKKDGWVSMMKDSGHAQVKAGYGYQLKMIVEYSTNAFSTEPNEVKGTNGSGTSVRPQNVAPNISKDIYFQTSDGKILSATGVNETNKMFVPTVLEQTKEKLVVEYNLTDTYTMGIKTPGRIYISEDTPNGMYKARAWTPTINGIPTKNKTLDAQGLTLYTPSLLNDILGGKVSSEPLPLPTSGKDSHGNIVVDRNAVPPMSILVIGSDKDDLVDSVVQ